MEKKFYMRPEILALELKQEQSLLTTSPGDEVNSNNWGGYGDDLDD